MVQRRLSRPEPVEPPLRPQLADQPSRFVLLEREVELEYRPQMLAALQRKVNTVAEGIRAKAPECARCGLPMSYHDARPLTWLAHWGRLHASPARYRCSRCNQEQRPLLDLLGVEPGPRLWFFGSPVGTAGGSGAIRTGGTAGASALGSDHQRYGCVAGGTTIGTGGGRLQRGSESLSRRQPE